MAGFRGSAANPSGLSGRTQCGLGWELVKVVPLMGNSCWASFQNKKDLDEQRFIGFSFPVLVTVQSMERKRVASFSLVDINCVCPKKEDRSKRRNQDVGQTRRPSMKLWLHLWHTATGQVGPQKELVSSFPSMPHGSPFPSPQWCSWLSHDSLLKHVCPSSLVHPFFINSATKCDNFFDLEFPQPYVCAAVSKGPSR